MSGNVYQLMRAGEPVRRKDGSYTWCVEYETKDGKRVTKSTFRTKKDAKDFLLTVETEIKSGTHVAERDTITIAAACDLWLNVKGPDVERSTLKMYRNHAEHHIKPRIGTRKLTEFDRADAMSFLAELRRELSPALARKVFTSLRSILGAAVDAKKVGQNVAAGMSTRTRKDARAESKRVPIPTREDMARILAGAREWFPQWYPLLFCASRTGMRASELRGLQWQDVDFTKREIRVEQRVDEWGDAGDPKTAEARRSVPMSPQLIQVLREWKVAQPTAQRAGGYVFPNGAGKPESLANIINRGLAPAQLVMDVADFDAEKGRFVSRWGMHGFRHFFASLLIADGASVAHVQRLLGHATPTITLNTYTHLFADRDRDHSTVAALDAAFDAVT